MPPDTSPKPHAKLQPKFLIGGCLIIAAVLYLVFSSTRANEQYFLTVDEIIAHGQTLSGKAVRVSGAVLGETIHYDAASQMLTFTIAHIPGDNAEVEKAGGLALVLHTAVGDATRNRLNISYKGIKPDLLKNEAQAILTGNLNPDGTFMATELLLKCPTKYEEAVPAQAKK